MPRRIADIIAVPAIFEFVLNVLQSTSTFSRIAHCINSYLQPELRSNSIESKDLGPDNHIVGDLFEWGKLVLEYYRR